MPGERTVLTCSPSDEQSNHQPVALAVHLTPAAIGLHHVGPRGQSDVDVVGVAPLMTCSNRDRAATAQRAQGARGPARVLVRWPSRYRYDPRMRTFLITWSYPIFVLAAGLIILGGRALLPTVARWQRHLEQDMGRANAGKGGRS